MRIADTTSNVVQVTELRAGPLQISEQVTPASRSADHPGRKPGLPAVAMLAALGVVYGDKGTGSTTSAIPMTAWCTSR